MKSVLNILMFLNLLNNSLGFSQIVPGIKSISCLSTRQLVYNNNINSRKTAMNMVPKNNFENNSTNITKIFRMNYNNDNLYEDDINETNNLILRIYIYAVLNVMIFEYLFKTFFQNIK